MTDDPKHERRAREYASGIPGLSITYLAQQFAEVAAEARAEALEEAAYACESEAMACGAVGGAQGGQCEINCANIIRALKQKETKP